MTVTLQALTTSLERSLNESQGVSGVQWVPVEDRCVRLAAFLHPRCEFAGNCWRRIVREGLGKETGSSRAVVRSEKGSREGRRALYIEVLNKPGSKRTCHNYTVSMFTGSFGFLQALKDPMSSDYILVD